MYKGDYTIKRMLIRSCRKLVVLKIFFVGGFFCLRWSFTGFH